MSDADDRWFKADAREPIQHEALKPGQKRSQQRPERRSRLKKVSAFEWTCIIGFVLLGCKLNCQADRIDELESQIDSVKSQFEGRISSLRSEIEELQRTPREH